MESGILYNYLEFADGEDAELEYDFDNAEYLELKEKYKLEAIAGDGSELVKAKRLMNEFSGRLYHDSWYDNHIDMNALSLLEYSLDNKNQGINCRSKAQILNEMCLALGIYSRKVWINPNSVYDNECHVVNEVYDTALSKWVMLDVTNNFYWIDENGTPLSILEIREKLARQEFCTPTEPGDSIDDPQKLLNRYYENFLYIAKNMVYTEYCETYTVGESEGFYALVPKGFKSGYNAISRKAIEKSPIA